MKNPLLTPFILPKFSDIKPEHVIPAIVKSLNNCRTTINRIIKNNGPYNWDNLCQPIEEVNNTLGCIFSPVNHLHSVKNNPELREVYEQVLSMLTEYNNWISHHEELYHAYCNLRNNKKNYNMLNIAQKKSVNDTLRNFSLSGINLPEKQKKRYSEITLRLSELSNQYNNNILDATMGWTKLVTDRDELSGIPDNTLEIAKIQAKLKEKKGWLLTLDMPIYHSIMTYCNNSALRKEMYQAYNTRASDQGPNANKWDNGPLMNEILSLRHELAKLLGFKSYAHKSLATKMAESPQKVLDFLNDIAKYARKKGEQELKQLRNFAKTKYGLETLHPWDITWYSEKQKYDLYGINDEEIRPYFPIDKVLSGLFEIVKRIYRITIKSRHDIDIWHPDVKFFEIYDDNSNELYGSFYLDPYTRENKRSGAWMDNCVGKMRKSDGSLQRPIAYLTCNFNRPINEQPALLTHNDVITLFHEFGHGLHHMLTRIETISVSGINGVPWDAVELPSQFMENWCWEPDALVLISGHYVTGKLLPKEIMKNILAAKQYQSATFILRQLELGLFDFRLHTEFNPDKGGRILQILSEIKKQMSSIVDPIWVRFPHTFSHIFSGGYAAGYYSYLWANVLASDIYSRFKEEGIFNPKTGQSFLDNILTRGGCEEPIKLFKCFLGREPRIDAMLKQYGIKD